MPITAVLAPAIGVALVIVAVAFLVGVIRADRRDLPAMIDALAGCFSAFSGHIRSRPGPVPPQLPPQETPGATSAPLGADGSGRPQAPFVTARDPVGAPSEPSRDQPGQEQV